MADTGGTHADEDFAGGGLRHRKLAGFERTPRRNEADSFHGGNCD
jgi:hypothetical protein